MLRIALNQLSNKKEIGDSMEEIVSICNCTRNRVEELKKAIFLIYKSTYQNSEIILSDDSTNDT